MRNIGRLAVYLVLMAATGCGSNSPTAPTPVAPPVVAAPTAHTEPPARPTLLDDPRFDVAFYRQFVSHPLYRWTKAPLVYLQTRDDTGAPIDPRVLDATAAAIIATTGLWSGGAFGVAGIERGTVLQNTADWINVTWSRALTDCGNWRTTTANAHVITINAADGRCMCPSVIKHELGHAMGYLHTSRRDDLMTPEFQSACDREPSARELFHSRVAYLLPVGSTEP